MIKNGWYICPFCMKQRLAKVGRHAKCKGVSVWCKLCRKMVELKLHDQQNNM